MTHQGGQGMSELIILLLEHKEITAVMAAAAVLSLFEISRININPWSFLLLKIKRLFVSESDEMARLEQAEKIEKLESDMEEMNSIVHSFSLQLMTLSNCIVAEQHKSDVREMNKLKDTIRQAYSTYHREHQWNSMEKEAMEGLIASYESCGGNNSFVHSIVQKEMYTWEVIDD